MRALVSVSNKTGLADFCRGLQEIGVEILSTGGTKQALEDAGMKVRGVSEVIGSPEILDGRVKTLHPAIHGGILARRDLPRHMAELKQQHIEPIDMVVVNLYPFVETVKGEDVVLDEALEKIDIGGPSMIRSAAKNYPSVLVVVDPGDYQAILQKLCQGEVALEERRRLAYKAFQHVAMYDTAIAQYLNVDESFPEQMTIALQKGYSLRYGENPHQEAAFYEEQTVVESKEGLPFLSHLHGPEVSFNNLLDANAALSILRNFADPTVVVIKHGNPCGLASHECLAEAYRRALSGDPVAAFGGVVVLNLPVDLATAREINETHYDAVIAPEYVPEALELLGRKKKLRLVRLPMPRSGKRQLDLRCVTGGFLVQASDFFSDAEFQPEMVTDRQPTEEERSDLAFAWKVVKDIKSNAIAIVRDKVLLGMGAGQPSRVVSVELALARAGDRARRSVLASDAFFPFADGPELAAKAGVTAFVQPGGSVRDKEVIAIANKYGIAMMFTGRRHFKH